MSIRSKIDRLARLVGAAAAARDENRPFIVRASAAPRVFGRGVDDDRDDADALAFVEDLAREEGVDVEVPEGLSLLVVGLRLSLYVHGNHGDSLPIVDERPVADRPAAVKSKWVAPRGHYDLDRASGEWVFRGRPADPDYRMEGA